MSSTPNVLGARRRVRLGLFGLARDPRDVAKGPLGPLEAEPPRSVPAEHRMTQRVTFGSTYSDARSIAPYRSFHDADHARQYRCSGSSRRRRARTLGLRSR